MSNVFKTGVLLAVLTALLVLLGDVLGGRQGMVVALVLAGVMNFASYWFSDRFVLAAYGGRPVREAEAPLLHAIVRRLAQRAGIPMPRVFVIPSAAANAFATGRDPAHAAVALTEGIVRILDDDELQGVLTHELAHVKNRDRRLAAARAEVVGSFAMTSPPSLPFVSSGRQHLFR